MLWNLLDFSRICQYLYFVIFIKLKDNIQKKVYICRISKTTIRSLVFSKMLPLQKSNKPIKSCRGNGIQIDIDKIEETLRLSLMIFVKLIRLSQIEIEELIMINSWEANTLLKMPIKSFNGFSINMESKIQINRNSLSSTILKGRGITTMFSKYQETLVLSR